MTIIRTRIIKKLNGSRPTGFEPAAFQTGCPARLCFLFESLTATNYSIAAVRGNVKTAWKRNNLFK
jgi:hypothetical protein